MAVANRRSGNDGWRDRYLLLQAEMIDDARRWFSRIENLVQAQVEQMRELRDESERAMEEGFEEAYKMLRTVSDQKQLLEAENKQLRDRVTALSRRLHEID
jgi:predicted nuclease with TOPRIM domain